MMKPKSSMEFCAMNWQYIILHQCGAQQMTLSNAFVANARDSKKRVLVMISEGHVYIINCKLWQNIACFNNAITDWVLINNLTGDPPVGSSQAN